MRPHSVFELLLLSFFWGSSFLLIQVGVAEFGPAPLIFLRTMIAGLVLLLVLAFRREVWVLFKHWKNFIPLGLLDSSLPYMLSAYAALHIPSGTISVINAVTPLWGALVAWLWLGIRLTVTGALGLLIGLLGITFLVWERFELALSDSTLALTAAVLGPICYALSACYAKKYLSSFSPFVNATGSSLTSGVLLLPLAWYWWPTESVSSVAWLAALVLAVLCSAVAYVLYYRLIQHIGPARAMTVSYLVPVVGLFWGWTLMGEHFTLRTLLGVLLIFTGLALANGVGFKRVKLARVKSDHG
ncbi:DMT family transporter [Zwartia sp.]|uniref:DMT family transporter n=1 Tax=Zwartia sp. TaxID=2978004 RepID=UPI003BAF0441